jgi:hypothetical protein
MNFLKAAEIAEKNEKLIEQMTEELLMKSLSIQQILKCLISSAKNILFHSTQKLMPYHI